MGGVHFNLYLVNLIWNDCALRGIFCYPSHLALPEKAKAKIGQYSGQYSCRISILMKVD